MWTICLWSFDICSVTLEIILKFTSSDFINRLCFVMCYLAIIIIIIIMLRSRCYFSAKAELGTDFVRPLLIITGTAFVARASVKHSFPFIVDAHAEPRSPV